MHALAEEAAGICSHTAPCARARVLCEGMVGCEEPLVANASSVDAIAIVRCRLKLAEEAPECLAHPCDTVQSRAKPCETVKTLRLYLALAAPLDIP